MTFEQKITKHVLEIYDYMLDNGIIDDKREFCQKMGISEAYFGRIQAGEIDYPEDKLLPLTRYYYANITYIIHGKGKMFWARIRTLQMDARRKKQSKARIKGRFMSLEDEPGTIDLIMN